MIRHYTSRQGYRAPTTRNRDLGTPSPGGSVLVSEADLPQVELSINGQSVSVAEGTSIMRAAALIGINMPRLCATDSLQAFGSCRLCLVKIEGRDDYPAACTTQVEEGLVIHTQTPRLAGLRRNVMELYLSDHPLNCLTCSANGDCELQDMAGEVGLREVRYGLAGRHHLQATKDASNPYFSFDPTTCIVCSRCVRACDEVQGTYALTIANRGFDSSVSVGPANTFMASDCVSCGACVQACPTSALMENSVIEQGLPERKVVTTCAYCGVGCAFEAHLQGEQVVRMVPWSGSEANRGHSCVKGRFAFGYATHADRVTQPMIRNGIDDPWRQVSWDVAIGFAADRLRDIQAEHGLGSIGGITSSRCTNEENYLVQKMVRAAFGNNNIDTCARVCHSPTGYGLKQTLGECAGTQDFDSVEASDVILIIGANPTDSHPVFASRLKKRLRQGAKLIVADPRLIDLIEGPHLQETIHLPLLPGTNVAFINAMAHVIVTEDLWDQDFVQARCEQLAFDEWLAFITAMAQTPEVTAAITGVPADELRAAARLYARGVNSSIYYGLGVTEHSQGSTMVMAIANLAMLTGNMGRDGVGVNPMRGQNNVQGACDMGSFPHELPGYRSVKDDRLRSTFEAHWRVELDPEPGLRIPNMLDEAVAGNFKGLYCQGEDIAQSDPNTAHVEEALRNMDCVIIQDIFLNETVKFAHVFLPGASFLEKDGTYTNAERRISPVRKVMAPLSGKADWEATMALSNALGYAMNYGHPREVMAEIAELTPTFAGVSYDLLDALGSIQWPCNTGAPRGTQVMHQKQFVRGLGRFVVTEYVATKEKTSPRFPLLLTTGRILNQYNVGAQTRRTANSQWHAEDLLEIHPDDAQSRGIAEGDRVRLVSRAGETSLRATLTEQMQPGVVYTTFHHPDTGANLVTTENADWATSCPEYKVTAVEVRRQDSPSDWQRQRTTLAERQCQLAGHEPGEAHRGGPEKYPLIQSDLS